MKLITIDQAREHCKADAADDGMLEIYANAAEKMCEREANRDLFPTQEALDAAIAAIPAAMSAAFAADTAAVEAAELIEDDDEADIALEIAERKLSKVRRAQDAILYGIVADFDIIGAVLLTTAHLYRNREDVVTEQGATAVQLPRGAAAIMALVRRV